jgi:hypothetical protein
MLSSRMLRRVALVRTDVSEELSASLVPQFRIHSEFSNNPTLPFYLALSRGIYDPRYFPLFVPLLLLTNPAF